MVFARRRQGRRFPPEHLGRRRGKIHHGIVAARKRAHAGSRVHSCRAADAVTSVNAERTSQAVIRRPRVVSKDGEPYPAGWTRNVNLHLIGGHMSPETLFRIHLVLGYVAWLLVSVRTFGPSSRRWTTSKRNVPSRPCTASVSSDSSSSFRASSAICRRASLRSPPTATSRPGCWPCWHSSL